MVQVEIEDSGTIKAKDGLSLYFRQSIAKGEKARILLVHGLCEHSGRYGHLIDRLNADNLGVFTYDHRGHGRSEGKRGHIENFSDYIDDLSLMLEKALSTKQEGIPVFLLGHSMGGLIVLNYAERHDDKIDGVIASSPGLAPAGKIPGILKKSLQILSMIAPAFPLDNRLDPRFLSHDQQVVDDYENDPLVHRKITASWFTCYNSTMDETVGNATLIKNPVLMQVAGDDRIVDPSTSRIFFDQIASPDKTLHVYEGLYHEIYNETDSPRKQVISDLEKWLHDHL